MTEERLDAGARILPVRAMGEGSRRDEFEKTFLDHLTCRLVLFRFLNANKDPRQAMELASAEFRPSFGVTESFQVDRFLGSTVPGANFAIGNGLGVAVIVEKRAGGLLKVPVDEPRRAAIRIQSVKLEFSPRNRDESVTE